MKKRLATEATAVEELQLEHVIGLNPNPSSMAYSQGSSEVAYIAGCVVVIYDARANVQRLFLRAPSSNKPFNCVAFSPGGTHVAAGEHGSHPSLVVWELTTQLCVAELKGHKHGVASICFSPSGKHLVSCGTTYDSQVCYWSWQSKALLGRERTQNELRSVSFSADGSQVISAGKGHLKIWNVSQVGGGRGASGGSQASITLTGRSPILGGYKSHVIVGVAASPPAAATAAAVTATGPPCLYAITNQGTLLQMKLNSKTYDRSVDLKVRQGFAVAASEGSVAVGCSEGIVRVFAARTLSFKANVPRPAAHGDHGLIDQRQSITRAMRPGSSTLFPDTVALSFDGSGDRLAVVYSDHSIFVWDIRNLSKVGRFRSIVGHSGPIWGITPLPDATAGAVLGELGRAPPSGTFATVSSDGTLRLWNLGGSSGAARGAARDSWQQSTYYKALMGVIQVGDGRQANDESLVPPDERPVGGKTATDPLLRCVRASPDGRHLATGDVKGNLWVYDVSTLRQAAMMEAHDSEILCLEYSSCGSNGGGYLLASGGRDGLVHVYDAEVGYQRLATLDDQSAAVTSVKFADGGNRVVTCGSDRSVVLRNILEDDADDDGGSCQRVKVPGRGALYDMELEATGRYAMTTGEGKKFHVYEVASGRHRRAFSFPEGASAGGEAVKLSVDPAGITMAVSHTDRRIRLYDFYTGDLLAQASGHGDVATGSYITSDCTKLISVAGDSCIFVYRMPPKLTVESLARLSDLEALQPRAAAAEQSHVDGQTMALTAAVAAAEEVENPHIKKREKIDLEGEPLTSDRLRAGKALVSTRKLPRWAQARIDGASPLGEANSENTDASYDLSSTSEFLAPPPGGRWAENFPPDLQGLQPSVASRRFTVEPSDFLHTVDTLHASPVISSPSHPDLADQAEAEDEIVYYSDEGEEAAPAGGDAFEAVDPPSDLSATEEEQEEAVEGSPSAAEGGAPSQGNCGQAEEDDEVGSGAPAPCPSPNLMSSFL